MTLTAKFWMTPDAKIERIYVADGFLEIKHVGARGNGWADSIESKSTVSMEVLAALAAKLNVAPAVNHELFSAFCKAVTPGKKMLTAKNAKTFQIEVA